MTDEKRPQGGRPGCPRGGPGPGHSKQKIRTSVKKVLQQISRTMATMEELDPDDPFNGAGANSTSNLRAHHAYQDVLLGVDEDEVNRMIGAVDTRAWMDEEYAKVARVLVSTVKKLATTI